MASCTRDGQPEKALRDCIDLLIRDIENELSAISFIVALGSDREVSGRHEIVRRVLHATDSKQVTGQLSDDEIVVRHVVVECVDDPVAVSPGLVVRKVYFLATGFREASHVEPMPSPAFAERRGIEETIDRGLECERRAVGHESFILFDGRLVPSEIEAEAPKKRCFVRIAYGTDPFGFEPGENECIDVVVTPPGFADLGNRWVGDGLE